LQLPLSQRSHPQAGVTGGRHIHLQAQQYLWTVSFFVSQVRWQTGSMQQPHRGQRSQHPLPAHWGHAPCSQPVSSPREACPASVPAAKIAKPTHPMKKRVMFLVSCFMRCVGEPALRR
jgi:hypothetical protein